MTHPAVEPFCDPNGTHVLFLWSMHSMRPLGYLKDYDPDSRMAAASIAITDEAAEALRFKSGEAAFRCWQLQSTSRPRRHDGAPNRPLTAFHAEVKPYA